MAEYHWGMDFGQFAASSFAGQSIGG